MTGVGLPFEPTPKRGIWFETDFRHEDLFSAGLVLVGWPIIQFTHMH